MTMSFPIEGYHYSNYTRVFLSSVVEQWKLVHLISVFQYLQYSGILSSTCLNVEVYSTITSNEYEDELLTKRRDLYQFLLNLQ